MMSTETRYLCVPGYLRNVLTKASECSGYLQAHKTAAKVWKSRSGFCVFSSILTEELLSDKRRCVWTRRKSKPGSVNRLLFCGKTEDQRELVKLKLGYDLLRRPWRESPNMHISCND